MMTRSGKSSVTRYACFYCAKNMWRILSHQLKECDTTCQFQPGCQMNSCLNVARFDGSIISHSFVAAYFHGIIKIRWKFSVVFVWFGFISNQWMPSICNLAYKFHQKGCIVKLQSEAVSLQCVFSSKRKFGCCICSANQVVSLCCCHHCA